MYPVTNSKYVRVCVGERQREITCMLISVCSMCVIWSLKAIDNKILSGKHILGNAAYNFFFFLAVFHLFYILMS